MTLLNGMGVIHSSELFFVFQHFLTAKLFSTWSDVVEMADIICCKSTPSAHTGSPYTWPNSC